MNIFCCSRLFGDSDSKVGRMRLADLEDVQLDANKAGQDVVLVKNGNRICGSGGATANAPIHQNKAYFEAKLQSSGVWGLGLATRLCNLDKVPLGDDKDSWVIRESGGVFHNGTQITKLATPVLQEGDIMGFTYDHVELTLYVNGEVSNVVLTGVKGTVYPVVYVDDGAIIDMNFSRFFHQPPDGFEEIMIEKNLL